MSGPPALTHPLGTRPIAGVPPLIARSAPRELSLIPGDVVAISVYRQPDLATEIRIPQGGTIRFPLIGTVTTNGCSIIDVENEIRQRLDKDFLKDPQVTVTVKEYAPRKIYVLGGVTHPSGYQFQPTERVTLLQLIAAAGGTTDKAYKEFVQIVRRGNREEREVILLSVVDVERSVASGKAEADLELYPDDLVVIPSAARVVYVLGAVEQPGWFEIPADTRMTTSMAISRAGSFTKFAAKGSIQILRQSPTGESKRLPVDMGNVLAGRLEEDLVLEPGDVVWVPERGFF